MMKKSIKIAVAAALALSASSAFATNGDTMIGVGAKAIGMGGVGIGMSHGAESALTNPAMITSVKGTEVSFGGTVFMPDVKTDMGIGEGSYKSSADLSVVPTVATAQNVGNGFYWGVGMYGVAGMGTDYRDANTVSGMNNMNMQTNLQLMQFVVPLAYKIDGFSVGFAPILQYGSLDINYDMTAMGGGRVGSGVAQDFGLGYNVGLGFEANGLTLGASYKSAIDMDYLGQLSTATAPFAAMGALPAVLNDRLEQPAEIGAGVSYTTDGHTFAFDYKRIKWSSANGYKDFKWEDQNVYMLGYQYAQDNWALRAGYNYAKSPIREQNFMAPGGSAMNIFNLLGFPAIVEKHYTIGGTYAFSDTTSLDLAYVHSPEKSEKFAYSLGGPVGYIETKHKQNAVTAQLNFNF